MGEIWGTIIAFILIGLLAVAPIILIYIAIIRAICKYAAKKNAEEIAKKEMEVWKQKADYLAKKIAENINGNQLQ